jgi:hypothetical protein
MNSMKHALYKSIEEMIRPETLNKMEHKTFTATQLAPFQGLGFSASGSKFLAVRTANGNGNGPRYVIKRVSREWDWIMNTTGDRYGRTTTLWQYGILDRLPPEIEHTVVACAMDGTGRAILMHDVTELLLPESEQPISEEENEIILDAMAALHAAFWEDPILDHPALNLGPLEQAFNWASQEMARQLWVVCPHEALVRVIEGWDLLAEYVEADVAELLRALVRDPSPLCTALTRFPQTLVHHDMRMANLGVVHGASSRLLLLDWMRAVATAPAIDLAWYLISVPYELFMMKELLIEMYKQRLTQRIGNRFDESLWQPQMELGFLAVLLQTVGFKAWFVKHSKHEKHRIREQALLAWCSEHARTWAKWLAY